jgi:type II secretory pathway predicted ATPase ExeA
MYLSYYNLKAKPFQMSTDPAFLWLGEKHREALAVLKYAILENKGVLALTGDVGTGKTTLINALLESLGEDTVTATIYDPRLEVLEFFNTVAAAFRLKGTFDGKGKFILKFMDFLMKAHERNQKVLLIIDEAQGINEDLLEEIRLLSNLEAEYTRLLNIFFVGQNEFIDIIQKYENRALRQRVTIRYHIQPLTLNETAAYIKHRLEVAGSDAPIFASGAIDEIFFFSGGYPRLINIMCDHALLSGYVREIQVINANLIRECREELLVSKQTSENEFQHAGNDHRSLPNETMFSEPPPDPFIPVDDAHSYSEPPPDPITPVEDSHSYEDEQMVFSTWQPKSEREEPRRSSKKRFFRSPIAIALILIVGIAAGYFFYGNGSDMAESFVSSAQQQARKYLSEKAESENAQPSTVQTQPDTSDMPGRIEAGKVGDSRFFMVNSPNSDLLKEPIKNETETPQVVPSKQLPEGSSVKTYTAKPENKMESTTTKPVSNLRQKAPLMVPITQKTPDKIVASAQMPVKTPSPSPSVSVSSVIEKKKKSASVQASKIKQSEIQTPASKPVPMYEKPKISGTVKTKTAEQVEKPEAKKSITTSNQTQKKTSEGYISKSEDKKKKEPDKPAATLTTIPLTNPPKETVGSKKILSGEGNTISGEKASSALSVSKEKKTGKRVDEKVASITMPAKKSETADRAGLNPFNLHARLKTFLNDYCRTYEQKDLDKFSTFFALNAVEKGKPFRSWLSKYRQNFNRIDSLEYNIELERYATQEETGLVKIDGLYHVRAKLSGSKEWRKSSGQISMVLEAEGGSFKVRELDY